MWPILGGLITGGMGLLGSMFSSDTSAQNTQANIQAQQQAQAGTQQFNAAEAAKSRDFTGALVNQQQAFQQEMSGTAYQRASADMTKAGLNPAMMFGSGSAASTPSGASGPSATASSSTPNMALSNNRSPFQDLGRIANDAVSTAVQAKGFDKMTDEIANLQETRKLITAQTEARTAEASKTRQEEATEKYTTDVEGSRALKERYGLSGAQFSAKSFQDLLAMPDWLRESAVRSGWLGKEVRDATSAAGNLGGVVRNFNQIWKDRIDRGY